MDSQTSVTSETFDVVIVGAGPVGLYATYCAGFRSLKVALVDSLSELGGQVSALYPEKPILDVAAHPQIPGREMVGRLVEQAMVARPTVLLTTSVQGLAADGQGYVLELSGGRTLSTRAVLLTVGIGAFAPRPLPTGHDFHGRGLQYFVPSLAELAGLDVVVVGGGDSAVDWALNLGPIAKSTTLVHRRDSFRAHAANVDALHSSDTRILTWAQIVGVSGQDSVQSVEVEVGRGQEKSRETLPADRIVAALGFVADLSMIEDWGIESTGRHITVDTTMSTNVPGVYAAGDCTEYRGKVRLISVGFGEAATAINNIAHFLDPELDLFPGHSTDAAASSADARV